MFDKKTDATNMIKEFKIIIFIRYQHVVAHKLGTLLGYEISKFHAHNYDYF